MAWVRKLASGKYQGKYYDADGRQRSVGSFARKSDAQTEADKEERRVRSGEYISPDQAKAPLGEHFREFIEEMQVAVATGELNISSLTRDVSLIENHILPTFARRVPRTVTTRDVRTWVHSLTMVKGLASSTMLRSYELLSKVFDRLEEEHYLRDRSPCRNIKLPKRKRSARADRWLRVEELERLAEMIEPRYRCVILLMGYMGLRIGEVRGLTMECLDLLHGTLDVRYSLQELQGLRLKDPKSESSFRKLPLPPFLVRELQHHLDTYSALSYPVSTKDCGWEVVPQNFVFTGPGGAPLRSTWAARKFRKAAVAANIYSAAKGPNLRPHHLRHTCATLLIARGKHPKDIQEWLGHSSYVVTMDVYGHFFPERLDDIADDLEAMRVAHLNRATPTRPVAVVGG